MEEFRDQIGTDLQTMTDPLLGAMHSDLSSKANAEIIKAEILAFDKKQENDLNLPGGDYIEAEKRRLTLQVGRYESLLADPQIRAVMEKWGTTNEIAVFSTSAEEYKNTSFTNLLKFLKSHPEYNSEIQGVLTEIESEEGLSEELQEFSDTLNNEDKERNDQIDKKEELEIFMEETLHSFDTLLQLEAIDEENVEDIKQALINSYKIYIDNFSKITNELANNSIVFKNEIDPASLEVKKVLTPELKEKVEQIEKVIEELKGKYGDFTQVINGEEQENPEEKSEEWNNRLRENETVVSENPKNVYEKNEIARELLKLRDINREVQNEETNERG